MPECFMVCHSVQTVQQFKSRAIGEFSATVTSAERPAQQTPVSIAIEVRKQMAIAIRVCEKQDVSTAALTVEAHRSTRLVGTGNAGADANTEIRHFGHPQYPGIFKMLLKHPFPFFCYIFTINLQIVYHEAQQFNHFSPNNEVNNFDSFTKAPNEFRLNVQIHGGRSSDENIGSLSPTDLKFSVSIDSDRRDDVNRDYIVEYVSDLNGFRVKVEIAQRELEPRLRGFGGGYGGGEALSPDTLKSGTEASYW
uniref:Uncharacterized protein n=1 Tax=Glossina austeni TaxID=7395 RepID=A0A1A9VWL8_GLOAU